MQIISSSYSKNLTFSLCKYLNLSPLNIDIKKFSSGEYLVTLPTKISKAEPVVIVGSMVPPTNDSFMEILTIIDAAERAGVENITLVSPYLGYSRQDLVQFPYSSLGVGILARLLKVSRINRLITVDIHSAESLKLFSFPVVNISSLEILNYYKNSIPNGITFVAPDKGSAKRLEAITDYIVTITKTRTDNGIHMELQGDVRGKDCLIVDDILDSGSTMNAAARCLKAAGAGEVKGYVTHLLSNSPPQLQLYSTDSVETDVDRKQFVEIFYIAQIIAEYL